MAEMDRHTIYESCIYALGVQDVVYLKKLELLPTGRVKVISENKEYPPSKPIIKMQESSAKSSGSPAS